MPKKPTYAELEKRVLELEQAEIYRKRAEKTLRDREARFRSYFDLGLVGMAITSPNKRWLQFNDRLCEILAYPRVELAKKTWADLTHPDDLAENDALFQRVLAGEIDGYSMNKRFIKQNGEIIHAYIAARCIRKEDGTVRHFVSLVHDTTKGERMTAQLAESERRLSLAMAASKQGWFDLDIPTGAIKVSPEYTRLLGYEPEEFNSDFKGWMESIHPEDLDLVLRTFRDCIKSNESRSAEYRRRKRDNSWIWIRSVGKVVEHGGDGKPLRMTGTHADITDKKQVEMALGHSEERFRQLLKNVVSGVFIIRKSDIMYLDPESGIDNGSTFHSLKSGHFTSSDIKKIETFYKEILITGLPKDGLEVRFFPDGNATREENVRWVHCKGSWIKYAGTGAVMIALVDVTRVKEMEKVLQMRERMASLGQVAAGIAHEIRNPLSGINIFLEGIAENFENPENREDIRMLIREANKAAGKIEATIKRVLDFSRPGKPRLKEADVNIPVREALDLMATTIRKAGVLVETDLSPSLPPPYIDTLLMEQVILNLMNNALDAMKGDRQHKRLRLTTRQAGRDVLISVSDSGPGVSSELAEKIFTPFFTTKTEGSGIGLSFCQRVMADHNGTIGVAVSEWGGAEFTLKLPIDKRVLSR